MFTVSHIPRLLPNDQNAEKECQGIRLLIASKQFRNVLHCVPDDGLSVARRSPFLGSKSSHEPFVLYLYINKIKVML